MLNKIIIRLAMWVIERDFRPCDKKDWLNLPFGSDAACSQCDAGKIIDWLKFHYYDKN